LLDRDHEACGLEKTREGHLIENQSSSGKRGLLHSWRTTTMREKRFYEISAVLAVLFTLVVSMLSPVQQPNSTSFQSAALVR
jgi:hypothetical protein